MKKQRRNYEGLCRFPVSKYNIHGFCRNNLSKSTDDDVCIGEVGSLLTRFLSSLAEDDQGNLEQH